MNNNNIYILTGEIRTGKTSTLLQWCLQQKNVGGILTPEKNNKRIFLDIQSLEEFAMEADGSDSEDALAVGRFVFSKKGFEKAAQITEKALTNKNGWVVMDEIGPLELKGLGFAAILKKYLSLQLINVNMLIVVRTPLLDAVIKNFNLEERKVIILKKEDLFLNTNQ